MTTKIEISSSMSQVDVCIVNKEVTFIGPRASSNIDSAFAIVLSSREGSLTLIPLESRVLTYRSRTLRPHEPVQIKANGGERFAFSVEGGIQCRVLRAPRKSAPPTTLPMTEIDDEEEDEEEKQEGQSPNGPKSDINATFARPSSPSHTLPLPETSTTPENNGGTVTLAMPEEKSTSNLPTATVPMAGGDTDEEEEEIATDDNEDEATRESAAPTAAAAATVPAETQLVTQAGPSDLVTQGSVNELEPLVTQLDDDLPPGEIMTTQSDNDKPSPQKVETDEEEENDDDANSVNSEDMLLQKTAPLTPHTGHRTAGVIGGGGNGAFSTPSRRLDSVAESFRSPSTTIFDHMTDDEIRNELKSHRLDASGSRTVLAKRLAAHRAMSDKDLEDLPRTATPRRSPGVSSLAPTTVGGALSSKNSRRIVDEDDSTTAPTLKIAEDDGTSPTLKIQIEDENKADSSTGNNEMVIKSQSLREALKAERSPLHVDLTSSRDATTGTHFSGSTTGEALMALTKSNAESIVAGGGDDGMNDKMKEKNTDGMLMIKEDGEKDVEEDKAVNTSLSRKTKSETTATTTTTTGGSSKSTTRTSARSTRKAKKESKEDETQERPVVRVGTVEAAHALEAMRSSVSPTTNSMASTTKRKQSSPPSTTKEDEAVVDSIKKPGRKRVAVKQEAVEDHRSEKTTEEVEPTAKKSNKGATKKKSEPQSEEKKDEEIETTKRSSRRRVIQDEESPDDVVVVAEPVKEEQAPRTRRGQQSKSSSDEKIVEAVAKKPKVILVEEDKTDESLQPKKGKSGQRASSSKATDEEDVSGKMETESTTGKGKRTSTRGKASGGSGSKAQEEEEELEEVPAKVAKRGRAKVETELSHEAPEEAPPKTSASSSTSKAKRATSKSASAKKGKDEEESKTTTTAAAGDGEGPSSASKRPRLSDQKKPVVGGSGSKKQQQQKDSSPQIVFTNLEVTDVYRKYVAKIGGAILNGDDEDFDKNLVTHVVCLKGSLKRTQKLLRAMAMAGPDAPKIVHNDWLKDSADQAKVLDEKLYYPFEGEANMEEALRLRHRDESEGLLSGMTILVAKSLENEKNLPNYQSLLPIVTSAGGQIAIASKEELNKCFPKTTIVLGPNQAFTKPLKDLIEKRKLTWCAPTWLAQSIASYSLKTDSSDIIFNRGSFFI